MKKSKFDDQFRKEFLANVRPPEGSFEFYENVLDFNRKKPFYKRNSFVKNLLAICIFIFVVLLTNIVTFTCTINSIFYDNSYEKKLLNYLSDEYDVIKSYHILNTNIGKEKITVYLLENKNSEFQIMYKVTSDFKNLDISTMINEKKLSFESFLMPKSNFSTGDIFYISDIFLLENDEFNCVMIDNNTGEVLVKFYNNLLLL